MKIIKILNHNSIIVHDQINHKVFLLLYKGIGFGKKINEIIDIPSQCKTYELHKTTTKGKTEQILNSIDPIYLEISSDILSLAKRQFHYIDENILLPLADHIAFAIQRIQNGTNISNPFSHEIRLLYPDEFEIAYHAKDMIQNRLGYDINDDEIGYITLHIHSARDHNHEGMLVAVIINESIQEIAREYNITIDVNSIAYSRLMTHMKYLLMRLNNHEELRLDMDEYTRINIPQSYKLAQKILLRIEGALNMPIPRIETGYLAMHIERICHHEKNVI